MQIPVPGAVRRLLARDLATESAWGMVAEVATVLSTAISFALLGRSLGAEGYGAYASLYAIAGPLLTFAQAGVALAALQHIVGNREPIEATARSCLSITLVIGSVLTIGGSAAAIAFVEGLTVTAIVTLVAAEFLTNAIVQVAAGVVQAGATYAAATKVRLVLLLARVAVLVTLFAADALTVQSLGITMLVVSSIVAVWSLVHVGRMFDFTYVPGRMEVRHVKTNGLYSVAISANGFDNEGDKLLLTANGMVVETGLYSAAYRIFSLGMVPIGAVVAASHARFLHHEEGQLGQHLRRALQFSGLGVVYGVACGLGLFVVAPVLPWIVGDEFEGSVEILRWLSPVIVLRSIGVFPLNALMGLDRVALRTGIIVLNTAIALSAYAILIPIHGWRGAAMGTVISEVTLAAMIWPALVRAQRRNDREAALSGAGATRPSHPELDPHP